ncbi:S8 family peptidase [Roseburia hominis]
MDRVRKLIGMEEAKRYHLTGQGITAAVLDTGISPHPDLVPRIIGWKDCVNGKEFIYDDCGHGTHVTGILAGDGRCRQGLYAGIAPRAMLVCVKVLNQRGGGRIDDVIRGIRYVLSQKDRMHIRIVNISIGTLPHPENEKEQQLLVWVERLWDAGIVVVTAAGNLGPNSGSVTLPGISKKVITVGSCDLPLNTKNQKRPLLYSGCGPTADCVKKPDISAPGNAVSSCNFRYPRRSVQPYIRKNGTSMSTPMAAGAVALLLEKYPDMSNVEVKLRLWDCCTDVGAPENLQGHGRIHVGRLLKD